MVHLPPEVLLLVFPFLVQRDKLECMTTCRQWHDLILQHTLYRVIYLRTQSQLDKLIQKVKSDPTLGKKVERLNVMFSPSLHKQLEENVLPELFPNLREFVIGDRIASSSVRDYGQINEYKSHSWCKQIEKIGDYRSDIHIRELFKSGICKNLTYIAVTGRRSEMASRLIETLTNAPALATLRLKSYTMTFQCLELLHTKAPLISSLLLDSVQFNNLSIPLEVQPATSMKSLRCNFCTFSSSSGFNPQILYFRQKYTQLEDLSLKLQKLNSNDENVVNSVTEQRAALSSYLTILGSRLKTLSLSLEGFGNDHVSAGFSFDLLDDCGCQIENLEVGDIKDGHALELLAKSNQVQHLRSLSLKTMHYGDDVMKSLEGLKSFTNLKELTLGFYDANHQKSNRILELVPLLDNLADIQLETLRIDRVELEFVALSKPSSYPSLKHLTLSEVTYEAGIDVFISRVFPNITSLKLYHCFKGNEVFMFPWTDFSYLEIGNKPAKESLNILVNTLGDNQQRLYTACKMVAAGELDVDDTEKDVLSFPSMTSTPYDKSTMGEPFVSVSCKSVHNFSVFMMGHKA